MLYHFSPLFMNIFDTINTNIFINSTKIINVAIKSSFFFILLCDQSFEMFPKHNEHARISESFALNVIISVPLTNN